MSRDLAARLIAIAGEAAAAVREKQPAPAPVRDWLSELLDIVGGDVCNSDAAAMIAGCHADTIRSRAVTAMETGQPIGILVAGSAWLFSIRRLLDAIEAKNGLPARLAAVSRAEKVRIFRSSPTLPGQKPIPTEETPWISRPKQEIVSS
jgi:hypothetical protein